jgi:hypothetical protein
MGYMTGLPRLPVHFSEMAFAPGAIADHLTSCAGMLPDPCANQSTVWDWLALGATATYGTVSEPCAFEAKFPDPRIYFWYSRGFTAGEVLAMSVRNPYQGIWVGDPLAAPFAAPPSVRILSPEPHLEQDGTIVLRIAVAAHEHGAPPVYLDLYVDGRHYTPVTRPLPPTGNDLVVQIGTNVFSYTVAPGEELAAAAAGLAWAINHDGRGRFTAAAHSDRVDIAVRNPLDEHDAPLAISAHAEKGFAKSLNIGVSAAAKQLEPAEDGIGRAGLTLHLGSSRSYEFDYPVDVTGFEPGEHTFSFVVRDGTAMQCQSQTNWSFQIPSRP